MHLENTEEQSVTVGPAADTVGLNKDMKPGRIASLDALRGFDMLWIVGLGHWVVELSKCCHWPPLQWLAGQMHHPAWEGFRFYDLIFPLFLFIAGITIALSLPAQLAAGTPRWKLYVRITRRLIALVVLGVVYNGGLQMAGLENTRIASVLGLIGIGYFFAALIVLNFGIRGQIVWFVGILLGYWAALEWIPVPGFGAGVLTPEGSLATYIDQLLLPGRILRQYDPEGIMPCLSGISMALAGAMTGHWLKREDKSKQMKALGLFVAGIGCLIVGKIWGIYLPIVKNMWTGSFVIYAAGWSLLLLSVFYTIIDVLGFKKWAFAYVVVGMNSITIYLACRMINFGFTSRFLFGGIAKFVDEPFGPVLLAVGVLLLEWLFLYFLYRKKTFLRV